MSQPDPHSTDTIPDPDLSGRQLADYEILHRLGRGGMAEVYLAQQRSLRRPVAFKVLKRRLANDESYVRRFHHEAQAVASLVHANIVQIYEVGNIDGLHFIAQEYVRGQNLRDLLTRRGPLDALTAVSIIRQVAAALHRAGGQGITHRDIKPENILIATTGEVKVADFGLARVTDDDGKTVALTQIGMTLGTPLYMSPEQVEGRPVDPRSDIYSFGITCYQMLAGRPPFDGETPLAVAVQHLNDEPASLESLRPDLPPSLCRLVHKMLAKKPADRFQQAADLLRELRSLPIEGIDEAWPSGIDQWSSGEMVTLAETRLEATQKLAAVMKTAAVRSRPPKAPPLWMAALVLAGLATGILAAVVLAPKPLLEISPDRIPKVEQKDSAQEQYRHAYWLGTERAWKAVAEHFPPEKNPQNLLYARYAQQRLAELYLREDELDRAMEIFSQLASLEATEVQFRAFGLAGQAIVYARRGDEVQMRRMLAALDPVADHLDQAMRERLERIKRERGLRTR